MKSTGRWASLGWALLLLGAGVVLCFVPLFNILGYESSLVLSLLGSIAGVRQGALVVRRFRERAPGHGHGHLGAMGNGRLSVVLRLYLRGLIAAESLLVPPLIFLLLNGLRVRNCSYLAGFGFFLMMPVLSVACAVAVGTVAALATAGPRRALLVGYAVLALSLLWALLRFATTPAIYAHDPFFGYFPGALYDEEVAIKSGFFAARALHGLCALAALTFAAALLSVSELRLRLRLPRRQPHVQGSLLLLALLFTAAAAVLYGTGGRLGIYTDAATLNRHLYLEQRTADGHFVLRYRPGGPIARDLPLLLREHELRYAQLRDLLGVEPDWRASGILGWLSRCIGIEPPTAPLIVSYLFDTAEEKSRWMGAGHTYIAKPWRRELYLQHEAWPHPVLRHELAHIFAGAAGDRLLRVAMRYGLPQPGIIEGLAVAADWRAASDLSGHQVVLAMRRAGLEPPLAQVFGQAGGDGSRGPGLDLGLGFYRLPAGRAYAVAGSFCRYLLDRYGASPLLSAYHRGGAPADFAAAFQVPFATLAASWRSFIDEQPLKPESQEVAHERLRHKAVFSKVCAHELALRKQAAYAAAARGDSAEAVRLLKAVCSDDPDEPQHLLELGNLFFDSGQLDEAAQAAQALLNHPQAQVTPVLLAQASARLGDLAVLRGDLAAARTYYERAAAGPEPEPASRLTTAKRVALASERAGPLLLRVLVGGPSAPASVGPGASERLRPRERSEAVSVYLLLQAVAAEPTFGLAHYVLGRLLYERGGYDEADKELGRAEELGLPDGRFDEQALLLRGQAALLSGRSSEAEDLFAKLLQKIPPVEQGKRLEAEDLRDRAHRWPSLDGALNREPPL